MPPTNFYMPIGGSNEDVANLILIQLVLKLIRKLKASLWFNFFLMHVHLMSKFEEHPLRTDFICTYSRLTTYVQ